MISITQKPQLTLDPTRNVLDDEMLRLARELDAGLYLTGSQYYAGRGEDHDYRMVVADLPTALLQLIRKFPEARRLLRHLRDDQVDTAGLKFRRHGDPVSLQIHSTGFIDDLCRLSAVKARVLRTTTTSTANPVFSIDERYLTPQRHFALATNIWLVEIDQSPWLHGHFCTQIYHNMVVASRILRDAQGLSAYRRRLICRLAGIASDTGATVEVAVLRWLSRNQQRWSPLVRASLLTEFRLASQMNSKYFFSNSDASNHAPLDIFQRRQANTVGPQH